MSHSASAALPLRRGAILAGKYRLDELLGEGGMACVWSAYNLALELPVAIKLLRSGPTSARLPERLRHEACAAARLVHPSIVRVFDVALTDNGDPFIVMELLRGRTLTDELTQGPVSSWRALQLLLPIAEALAHSHAQGIVHRDLKPDNVFLATDGERLQPKLLDFGIAKLARASVVAARLTEQGTTLGSPNFMSPEQVRGEDVDFRSDIWSFCVVLHTLINGVPPFDAAEPQLTLEAILHDEPTPLGLGHRIDEQLASLIQWGLAKDPEQRPSSMNELGQKLAWWLIRRGVTDDASGASLATKWLARSSAPPSYEGPSALATPLPVSMSPALRNQRRSQRLPLGVVRRWGLMAAASLLLVSGGIAWASVAAPPRVVTEEPAATPREPAVVAAARTAPTEPVVIAMTPAAPTAAATPAQAASIATPTTSSTPTRRSRPAPRLPF